MFVEIKSANTANVRRLDNGKSYGEQQAALHTGADYPLPFKLNVEIGQEKKPGRYALDPGSFGTDKFGNLVLGKVRVTEAANAPAKP